MALRFTLLLFTCLALMAAPALCSSTFEKPLDGSQLPPEVMEAEEEVVDLWIADKPGLPFPNNFTSIQDAIDFIPKANKNRHIIHLAARTYREKVVVNKDFVTIKGQGRNKTVIVFNDNAATPVRPAPPPPPSAPLRHRIASPPPPSPPPPAAGSKPKTYGTMACATFTVDKAKYFIARSLTIMNDSPVPAPGQEGGQAVALRLDGDMSALYDCSIVGHQDTLCDRTGRHYFRNCHIQGTVDFIFGQGRSFYKNCELESVTKDFGSITAQGKSNTTKDPSGYSFVDCKVYGSGIRVSLGRAWGGRATVVFANSELPAFIDPIGWDNWGHNEYNSTVYFGEYQTYGDGSYLKHSKERSSFAKWMTDREARPFLTRDFVQGDEWLLSLT